MSALVSVIIPTYGRSLYLERALDSVFNQTYCNVEVLIVDDNGIGTEEQKKSSMLMLDKYREYENLIYIPNEINRGGAVARNIGIDNANGKYITFLDDDDEYLLDKVERQVRSVINGNLDVALCAAYYFNSKGEKENSIARPIGENIRDFLLGGVALTPMIMATKESLNNVGGFDETPRYQDHILMLKLLASGVSVGIDNTPLYKCYRHDGVRISTGEKSYHGVMYKHKIERGVSGTLCSSDRDRLKCNQEIELLAYTPFSKLFIRSFNLLFRKNCDRLFLVKELIKIVFSLRNV
ncbi:glycosyltransferase family 2 protein [Thalassolituus sp. UBA3500]|uniref:glycosyltransferase family 2 protein n=1 Tax=Thalassolituus sp. UBA3500 TaxID=1947664 RepID=UPI00263B5F4D|nr:glycosyltransferase family 2 protein [Thalassolituus sp. UBA3500]